MVRMVANRHVETPAGWQGAGGAVESLKASGPEPLRREIELFLDAAARHTRPAVGRARGPGRDARGGSGAAVVRPSGAAVTLAEAS